MGRDLARRAGLLPHAAGGGCVRGQRRGAGAAQVCAGICCAGTLQRMGSVLSRAGADAFPRQPDPLLPRRLCPPTALWPHPPPPVPPGFNLDSFMMRYQGVDWLDAANWKCNKRWGGVGLRWVGRGARTGREAPAQASGLPPACGVGGSSAQPGLCRPTLPLGLPAARPPSPQRQPVRRALPGRHQPQPIRGAVRQGKPLAAGGRMFGWYRERWRVGFQPLA